MGLNKRLIDQAGSAAGGLGEPTDNFDIVTYTGTSAEQSFNLGFEPDVIWIMGRNTSGRNYFVFDNTGADSDFDYLHPYNTSATQSATGVSTSDTGFTLQSSFGWNYTGITYVAWCWKAASSYSSNTDGSITSTVGANPDAGFSIVKYTSTGTSGSTIGHGLSSNPDLVIIKSTTNTTNWIIYNSISGDNYYLSFSSGSEQFASSWLQTPTGVFKLNNTFSDANTNGRDYIAYCFHSVDGYQKVGSYTGTGGAFTITTGFQPRFLMVRRTDANSDWVVFDEQRPDGIYFNDWLAFNSQNPENTTGGYDISFNSDGWTHHGLTTYEVNTSGASYIYWAIA